MASVILSSAGAAVGNALLPGLGGAVLGTLGSNLGGLVDSKLGLGTKIEGPRLETLSVQDSRYGIGIPLVYGRARVAGNVIWSSDLIEAQQTNPYSGGKGGGGVSTTTYSYSIHCAVGLARGVIGGISTIWADSKVIYQDGVWATGTVDSAAVYTGATTQTPDPFMQSMLGSDNVPSYQGVAYIVLENLQLANFGNRLPNLTFEIYPQNPASVAPIGLGSLDAHVNQFSVSAQNGNIPPLAIDSSTSDVRRVIVGGHVVAAGSNNHTFEVIEYDVTDKVPAEGSRVQSAVFSATSMSDCAWAMAPDNRFIAIYLQSSSTLNHNIAIYDSETRQFGSILSLTLPSGVSPKQIAWLDPLHFVMPDTSGTQRGVRVFTRAGLNVVDLGFFNVWGSGTTGTLFMLYAAQFTPFAGGLIAYSYVPASGVSWVSAIYGISLAWRNNTLAVGTAYTVASGLTAGLASGPHANLVRTSASEWTLCFGTVSKYFLMSFVPSATSAAITRPWQSFTPSYTLGTTYRPLAYGTQLVLMENAAGDNYYRVSEITLNTSSFTLSIDAAIVSNMTGYDDVFSALRLDSQRFLFAGVGGASFDVAQLGIIKRANSGWDLPSLVSDILDQAGYVSGDYDVSSLAGSIDGYVVQPPLTARSALEPLQVYSPFDLIESVGTLKAVPRNGASAVTISSSEWRAAREGENAPAPLAITRAQELDLPREVSINYIDAGRDFEVNSQQARRMVGSAKAIQKVNLPMVAMASTVKQIAEMRLYTLWAERELVKLAVSRRYLALDPSDVIDLDNGDLLRVTRIKQAGGLLNIEGFYTSLVAIAGNAIADSGSATTAPSLPFNGTLLYLLDMPLLQTSDDQPGFYAAVSGLTGWRSASLWRSGDGINYSAVATLSHAASVGVATSVLADGVTTYQDNAHSVTVQMMGGSLSSCAYGDLLNGANAAYLGKEIIQFQTATLLGSGYYQLSGLLRGRRGTESFTASHALGENFVLLSPDTVEFIPASLSDRNGTYDFRALTKGQALGDVMDTVFVPGMATIKPFAPVNMTASRLSGTGSDMTLVWTRRARLHAEWVDYIDVPLDEASELYDVEIMNGTSVMRSFSNLTTATVTYTAAQQVSDWGTVPSSFSVKIYQLSTRYGRGQAATATL